MRMLDIEKQIGRRVFIIWLLVSGACYYLLFYLVRYTFSFFEDADVSYLLFQTIIGLLFWSIVTVISMKRLRDLSWPKGIAAVYFFMWLFNFKNIAIYDLVFNDNKGIGGEWLIWVPAMFSILSQILLVLLVILPNPVTQNETGSE